MRRWAVLAVCATAATACLLIARPHYSASLIAIVTGRTEHTVATLRSFTVLGAGDVLVNDRIHARAMEFGDGTRPDFAPILRDAAALTNSADLSICHLEHSFSSGSSEPLGFPHLYYHPALADTLRQIGFDRCSTASNWTFDKGMAGIRRTQRILEDHGIETSGSSATRTESRNVETFDVNGVTLAHLSYTDPAISPQIPNRPWAINMARAGDIVKAADAARLEGAEFVILSLHMGDMGSLELSNDQERLVERVAPHVDLILGHGSHTVQPATKVSGTWTVWHGNFEAALGETFPRMAEGIASKFTVRETSPGTFKVVRARAFPLLEEQYPPRLRSMVNAQCRSERERWTEESTHLQSVLDAHGAFDKGLVLVRSCNASLG